MSPESGDATQAAGPVELTLFGFDATDSEWLERVRRASSLPALGQLNGYRLIEELNRGAQGVVFRAVAQDGKRSVAIKRLLAGRFATAAARVRFEREMEAASALQHPSIVRVLGIDSSDHNPMLVMDWVDGIPIDLWADSNGRDKAGLARATRVFLEVCDAVHHAHQRGVIHRDLKPSNILVDGLGVPHLLDFGLAKLIDEKRFDLTTVTGTNDFLGTPAFAAPEQVRGDHSAVEVRTDVYALGVVLYRVLTGRLPFDATRGLAALLHDIQTTEPARLSRWNPAVGDELDAIVAKTMAKSLDRRYPSVDALAADLRRLLRGEPVEAKRGRRWYELRKTLRRHRAMVSVAVAFLTLTTGSAVALLSMYGRQSELLFQATAARDAEQRARAAATQQQVVLERLLAAAAAIGKGADLQVRRAWLDEATRLVGSEFLRDPAAQAAAHDAIGRTYQSLALYSEAEDHLQRALALRRAANGVDHPDLAESLSHLGEVLQDYNRFAEAEPFLRQALAMRQRLFKGDHADVAKSLDHVGLILQHRKDFATAEDVHLQALDMNRRLYGENHPCVAESLSAIGNLRLNQNRYPEAEVLFREALASYVNLYGEEHRSVAAAKISLAKALSYRAVYAEAEALFREAIATSRRLLGDNHDNVAWGLHRLGLLLHSAGRYQEAAATLRESLAAYRQCFGDHDHYVAMVLNSLGTLLLDYGETDAVQPLFEEAVAIQRALLSPDDAKLAWSSNRMGEWLECAGKYDDAEPLLRAALDVRDVATGVETSYLVRTLCSLARLEVARRRFAEAEVLLQDALRLSHSSLGTEHPGVGQIMVSLGFVLDAGGEPDRGRRFVEDGLSLERRAFDARHPQLARSLLTLARVCDKQHDPTCAEDSQREANRLCDFQECPPPASRSFWWPAPAPSEDLRSRGVP